VALILFSLTGRADTASDVRDFTGAPTRAVWIQDAGDLACVYSERPTLRLMVFDTEDNKGERMLLPDIGWYAKPVITADGSRVVFADMTTKTLDVINWDGTGRRQVVKNISSFEDNSTWTDPKSGVVWVYAQTMEPRGNQQVPVIRRYQLDHPEINELIWDKMPIVHFMVSGDGRAACGGSAAGNTPQGMLTLPNGNLYTPAAGCWPSMSPDSSHRLWVFTGNHRSIHFCVPANRSGNFSVSDVRFDEAPGLVLKSNEEEYHPRWTNNIRYLAITSPYSNRNYKAAANIPNDVAAKVEVYVGKFKDDFSGIERWVQITHSKGGNYWPDIWIKPSKEALAALAAAPELPEEKAPATLDTKGLIYTWITGGESNQINDPVTGAIHQCSGQFRHNARFAPYEVMDLTDGAFVPDDSTAAPLLAACKASNQFAVEAEITPQGDAPAGEKIVMAFADDPANGNFVLAQQGDTLNLRLKTDGAGSSTQTLPLCQLIQNQPNHIIVSYADGKLACFVNGCRAILPNPFHGGLSNWTTQPLIFGDSSKGGQNWTGLMEDIGLFSRQIDAPEARQRYLKQRERTSPRKPIDTLVVEAKLIGRCPPADPQGIAPYRRCLSVQLYEVEKVISGKCDDKQITVAQWSVLDAQVVPSYTQMAVGNTYQLTLQKMDDRPEQQSERQLSGDFKAPDTIQLYYDTINPAPPATAAATPPQVSTWKGPAGDANAGGVWEVTAPAIPWSTGKAPGPGDTALLGTVTQGTREITTGAPETIAQLNLTQGHPGAVNRLTLGAPLTISGNAKPLALAADSGAELNLNGQPLLLTNGSLDDVTFNGTVRMAGNGAVAGATVLDGGFDYTQAPQVQFSGGGGQGATAEAVMAVVELTRTTVGQGYTSAPTVTISQPDVVGGRQATATARIDAAGGTISELYVTDPGSGYLRAPQITFSGGGGTGATAEATLSLSGIIVTNGGSGYVTPPKITLVGGDGQHSIALAALQVTTFRYTDPQGNAVFTNAGILNQDGTALIFDWAAEQTNSGRRNFSNSGTWTLKNGACVQESSSTNRPDWFAGGTNSGTLRVLDGSSLGFATLENSGELDLGAATLLGQSDIAIGDNTLKNTGKGVLKVLGSTPDRPATFGYVAQGATGKRIIENGTADGKSQAQFIVGEGQDTSTLTAIGGQVHMTNFAGGSLQVNPGAMLALLTNDNGSTHAYNARDAKITNAGDFLLAGQLRLQGNFVSFVGIENSGTLTIQGDKVVLERLPNSTGAGGFYNNTNLAQILNQPGALLQGSGDLTYLNSTGNEGGRYLEVTNLGTIAPGKAASSQAPESFGQLTFSNATVYFGVFTIPELPRFAPKGTPQPGPVPASPAKPGILRIGIGGPPTAPDHFDTLTITGTDDDGKLELMKGEGNTLNIVTPAGFAPHGTYRIVTAAAVDGTFDTLQYNGAPQVPYTVNYRPDGIEVVFP
jgi:hypothetical protein